MGLWAHVLSFLSDTTIHKLAKSNREIPKRKNIRSKIIESNIFLDITKSSEILGPVTLTHMTVRSESTAP